MRPLQSHLVDIRVLRRSCVASGSRCGDAPTDALVICEVDEAVIGVPRVAGDMLGVTMHPVIGELHHTIEKAAWSLGQSVNSVFPNRCTGNGTLSEM